MNAAAVIDPPRISDPCVRSRHHACQLGDECACLCHTPEGIPKNRPAIEKCETLREACLMWMQAIEGSYILREEVDALCAYMRSRDSDKWHSWLDANAGRLISELLHIHGGPDAAHRGNQKMSPASVFSDASESFQSGDRKALDYLAVPYVIDAENRRNVLAELTYDDLKLPIDAYDKRAKTNAMEAAYLRAVQKKLPTDNSKTVGDVFTNEGLRALRDKFVTKD